MKRCISCFRYCENAKDAKAKGLEVFPRGFVDYHRKPRPFVKAGCISVQHYKDEIDTNHPACDGYIHRWRWNAGVWWNWRFVPSVRRWYRQYVRVPMGARRAAVPLEWRNYFDGIMDEVIPNGEPVCSYCGEYPYSEEQCVFCGQRYAGERFETQEVENEQRI